MPTHPRGPSTLSRRRLAALPPHVETRAWYRMAVESYALPPEALPPSPILDAVLQEPRAIWPWGAAGDALDAAALAAEADAQRAKEAADAARIEQNRPNHRTLDQLEAIASATAIESGSCIGRDAWILR